MQELYKFNIIVNPIKTSIDIKNDSSLTILRAGFYPRVSNHCVFRGIDPGKQLSKIPYHYKKFKPSSCVLNEATFIYCAEGEGFLMSENQVYLAKKGDLIFCDTGSKHAYGANPNNPWTIYWFHFIGEFRNSFCDTVHIVDGCTKLSVGCFSHWFEIMEQIYSLLRISDNSLAQSAANSYLKACISEMLLNSKMTNKNNKNQMVQAAIYYMKQNLSVQLSLQDICEHINLSKYYFSRKFKNSTGYTPMNYFMKLKINKAGELLQDSQYSIQDISGLLGFSSAYYFSNTFKTFMGYSPTHYRQLMLNIY